MQKKKIASKAILLFLNPFLSGVSSLRNIRDGVSHYLLYLWFLIFGIGFCAQNKMADSYRYVEDFMEEHNYSWSQYVNVVKEWFTFESNIKDIYTLTVNVLVGQFTSNYHWTYLIYATIFGFFYIKSLRVFVENQNITNNFVFYALLFIFCFSNPIFNINGVRFWTSAWVGVYVALCLFVKNDYSKLPLLILMPLMHGSSVIWIVVIVVALLLSRFQKLVIVLYVASAFVSAVSFLNVLSDYSDWLPQFMQDQIWSYTESDYAMERMSGAVQNGAAYADFLLALPGYFHILLSLLLIINRKKINKNKTSGNLLTIMLALATITNFLSGIPSVGRFKFLVIPFLVIVWASNHFVLRRYDKCFYIVPLVYAYSFLYWYRNMSSVTEWYLYIFPTPITIIKYLFL